MRLAWFSPLPPHRSGIAAYSADVLSGLVARHEVTAFVDDGPGAAGIAGTTPLPGVTVRGAHDFPPAEAQHPHDVPVFQVGNDVCHHYMWPYLVHYPGLVVLHDGQLHQARARALIREFRADDYAAEFEFAHPEANPDVAQLVIDGLGGSLYYFWPMLRVPVESARLVAVHSPWLAASIRERYPHAHVTHIRMGVPDPLPLVHVPAAEIRRRHGIPDDAVVFAAYGRVTPEKGLTRVLMALGQLGDAAARVHILCVGETVDYYDLLREAAEVGLAAACPRHRLRLRRGAAVLPRGGRRVPVPALADRPRDVGVVAALRRGGQTHGHHRPAAHRRRSRPSTCARCGRFRRLAARGTRSPS